MEKNMYEIELKDTVDMMLSEDYKERFKAEFYQLHIRYGKLNYMLYQWDNDKLVSPPPCPREFYGKMHDAMRAYLDVLLKMAEIEGIEL